MANNCLVTKLKANVQNDNLPILGVAEIKTVFETTAENVRDVYITLQCSEPCTISSKNNTLRSYGNNVWLPSWTFTDKPIEYSKLYSASNNDTIEFDTKYGLTKLHFKGGNSLNVRIADFEPALLDYINIDKCHIDLIGISKFADTLESLLITFCPSLSYDVSELYKLVNVTVMNFDSSVIGKGILDWKTLALEQIHNGRNSATINIKVSRSTNHYTLFDGEPVDAGSYTLSWTSVNDIALN